MCRPPHGRLSPQSVRIKRDRSYFKGKRVRFTDSEFGRTHATVNKIGRDITGQPYIILHTSSSTSWDHGLGSVQAFFTSDAVPSKLQVGDDVAMSCTVRGLMLNVILDACYVGAAQHWDGNNYVAVVLK